MYPHRIRLRGPWEFTTPTANGRVNMPVALADTPLASHSGEIRFTRRFGYPGRIDPEERVLLLVENPAAAVSLTLNGSPLGDSQHEGEWDVTERLSERNELVATTTATPGPPWDEVALEVRRTAHLCDLRVWAEGDTLHATGTVAGHAPAALDLYLLAGRGTVAYTSITATRSGTSFSLLGPRAEAVEVATLELVQGAVAWYTAELPIAQGSGA